MGFKTRRLTHAIIFQIRQFPRNAAGHTRAIKEVIIVDIADTMRAVSLVISRCTEGYAYF